MQKSKIHSKIKRITALALVLVFLVTSLCACGNSPARQYKDAVSMMESGNYEDALAIFELISDYEDSSAIISIIGGGGTFGWATHDCRLALRPVCWIQLEG